MSPNPYQKPSAKLTSAVNAPKYSTASPLFVAAVLLVATVIMLVALSALEQAFGVRAIRGSRFLLTVLPSLISGVFLAKRYRALLPNQVRALGVLYFAVGYIIFGALLSALLMDNWLTTLMHITEVLYWLNVALLQLVQMLAIYAFVYIGERAAF